MAETITPAPLSPTPAAPTTKPAVVAHWLNDERNRDAHDNGRAHAERLLALYDAWQFCREELTGSELDRAAKAVLREYGYPLSSREHVAEAIEEAAREEALSVEVRSAWESVGVELEPSDWRILLTTGGPELWLTGHLNRCGEPTAPVLECRTWGTRFESVHTTAEEDAALEWFARLFYFAT